MLKIIAVALLAASVPAHAADRWVGGTGDIVFRADNWGDHIELRYTGAVRGGATFERSDTRAGRAPVLTTVTVAPSDRVVVIDGFKALRVLQATGTSVVYETGF